LGGIQGGVGNIQAIRGPEKPVQPNLDNWLIYQKELVKERGRREFPKCSKRAT
jgi:hypothetical protein